MNPKTLQYLMGHSDIGVTMNTYTHLGLDDAKDEMIRFEELEQARKELDKTSGVKPMKQNMDCQHFFRQIFLGYFPDIVQAFDTLRREYPKVCVNLQTDVR